MCASDRETCNHPHFVIFPNSSITHCLADLRRQTLDLAAKTRSGIDHLEKIGSEGIRNKVDAEMMVIRVGMGRPLLSLGCQPHIYLRFIRIGYLAFSKLKKTAKTVEGIYFRTMSEILEMAREAKHRIFLVYFYFIFVRL